ncbi:fibrobacter succinogenes major paralogous domain-containing protein [Fibrobacter sp. UBA4309]|uniref:fibrobacter succinogenes major paralogous domain-containing protein n=1 Tax=Fibrobacter sp. UBA4309 TaxID=1946537 RepID=UPI0025B7CA40|nr:fibrobacter succinogenes major paralogous domain-containing protein [Fibrobacter sp. UBA4309]
MKKVLVAMSLVAFAVVGCDDDDSWSPSDADNSRSSSVIPGSDPESSSAEKNKSSSSSADKEESSSSSVVLAVPCKTETEDNCEYDSLTDERDGQTYKTVKIGSQWWMAENLNYETGNSYCYNNNSANCTKYGRLYTWAAAMDSVGTLTTNGKGCGYKKTCSPTYPVRGICPEGWHLPSKTEFETLFTAVGGQDSAGTALKSTGGWFNDGNGTDAFGFSALPAGDRGSNGGCNYEGLNAYFWSSTEYDSNYAYNVLLYVNFDYAYLNYGNKDYGFSVRCLKD